MWKILNEIEIPDHLTCLLRNLYAGQEATVRTGHELEIELPYDPAIPLLGIHTEETRRERIHPLNAGDTRDGVPSADEWIRKLWYIYKMEYYSAIKKNTFESVLMRWMKLEPIIPMIIAC